MTSFTVQVNDKAVQAKTGPDSQPWKSNQLSTLQRYVRARSDYSKKTGKISKQGQRIQDSKKILQDLKGDLRRSIYWRATQRSVIIGSPKPYAAIHHYGGDFKAWGKITLTMPARPFTPIDANGNLYPAAQARVIKHLNIYLAALK
jgi:phage gpG-like protein